MVSKNKTILITTLLILSSFLLFCKEKNPKSIEVLHWWTSGGEAKAMLKLKEYMSKEKGTEWKDFAVAGGGGSTAMTVLKSRVLSGNPPSAVQIKGPSIKEWANQGVLANLDPVAKENDWDSILLSKSRI